MREKWLQQINKFDPFYSLIEEGWTPEKIKEGVIELLAPYIEDHSRLKKDAVTILSVEAVNLLHISKKTEWKTLFESVLTLYNNKEKQAGDELYKLMGYWDPIIRAGQDKYATQVVFELDKENMCLEDFQYECFRNIGAIVEATLAPFLRELLSICSSSMSIEYCDVVRAKTLGNVVVELQNIVNANLLAPSPWGVSVSQWRNIAQHHLSKVEGESIVCLYGPKNKELRLDRGELLDVVREVARRLSVIKGAREIFIYNHVDGVQPYILHESDNETNLQHLVAAFSTQGFKTTTAKLDSKKVIFEFEDLQPDNEKTRAAHCFQFLVPISSNFEGYDVEVWYRNQLSGKVLRYFATDEVIHGISYLEEPIKRLFELLEDKKIEFEHKT